MEQIAEYFVYGLVDPRDQTVFYIGKGKGNRPYDHIYKSESTGKITSFKIERIEAIQKQGFQPDVKFYLQDLFEHEAFLLEEILILRIGRKIKGYGPLTNILVGGQYEEKFKAELTPQEIVNLYSKAEKNDRINDLIQSIPETSRRKFYQDKEKDLRILATSIFEKNRPGLLMKLEPQNIQFYHDTYDPEFLKFQFWSVLGSILIHFNYPNEAYQNGFYRIFGGSYPTTGQRNLTNKEIVLAIKYHLQEHENAS
ncbi:MAG: GIY-YIG nuclease family protein [Flavobacteriales bacterium]|nr:GIY-YIG nuclease family protein [Flavobacteriales bacterium]